jgi:hypothetical protein
MSLVVNQHDVTKLYVLTIKPYYYYYYAFIRFSKLFFRDLCWNFHRINLKFGLLLLLTHFKSIQIFNRNQ